MNIEETGSLIVIEKSSVQNIFTEKSKIDRLLEEVRTKTLSIVPDVSTEQGRKNIKSLAYKVTKTKTYLDGMG
jgi:hypothetical protein